MRKASIAILPILGLFLATSCAADESYGDDDANYDPTQVQADDDDGEGAGTEEPGDEDTSVEAHTVASGVRLRSPINHSSPYSLISSHFRRNYRRYDCATSGRQTHRGVDFAVPVGTSVYAAAAGRVVAVRYGCANYGYYGNQCGGELGNHIIVLHSNGRATRYAHLKNTTPLVRVGQSVSCGQRIGYTASSGSSTGPHLHFGVFDGASASYPYAGTAKDPFGGRCSTQAGTMWAGSVNRPAQVCR